MGDLDVPRITQGSCRGALVGERIVLSHCRSSNLAGVGLQLWAGALVLADFLLSCPEVVMGHRIRELGAGIGLVSIIASRLGSASVLCTDGCAEIVANYQKSLQLNI